MKRIVLLVICFAILAFTGCGTDKSAGSLSGETQSDKNSSETDVVSEESTDEKTGVFENFSSGTIVDGNNSIKLKFDISSIEMLEKGLTFNYTISRDSSGYTNYYRLEDVKLNGCYISNISYYAGDTSEDDMGKNTTDDDTLPLNFVISTETLNSYNITEFQSLEFTLNSGYSSYSSAENEYRETFVIYSGKAASNPTHQLAPDESYITLVDNDKCKIVITDVVWLTNYADEILGQKYLIYAQAYDDVYITLDKLEIGDLQEQPEEYALSSNGYGSYSFQLDENTTYRLLSLWRDKSNALDATVFENAQWNMTLKYSDNSTEDISVPVNLFVSLDKSE